jgi:hypothetical protein
MPFYLRALPSPLHRRPVAEPQLRPMSETILDFGSPVISQLEPITSLDMVRSTFGLVIVVWNAHVMALPRWNRPEVLAELHRRLQDPTISPERVDAVRTLSQRRLECFASDARVVGKWNVVEQDGQWMLRCDATVPPRPRLRGMPRR